MAIPEPPIRTPRHLPALLALFLAAVPAAAQTLYDYANRTQGVDIFAYDGQSTTQVPGSPSAPTNVLSPTEYNGIEALDGSFHIFTVASDGRYGQMRFTIHITEPEATVSRLDVTWTGRAVNRNAAKRDGVSLYIWNYASGAYQLVQASANTEALVTLIGSGTTNLPDFIGGAAQDTVTLLVVTHDTRGSGQLLGIGTDYLKLEVTAGCTTTETLRDDFSTASYMRNDGSLAWSTPWVEHDDDGSPTSGHIQITGGELSLDDISDSTAHEVRIEREADLSGVQAATLRLDFRNTSAVDADDTVFLDISSDGGTSWGLLDSYVGAFTGTQSKSYDITAFATASTRVRLRIKDDRSGGGGQCCYGGGSEFFLLDFVEIAVTLPCASADHFLIGHDGNGIQCLAEPVTVTVLDAGNAVVTDYTGTITLDTGSGKGSWALTSGVPANFSDPTPNDGLASYAFDVSDAGVAGFTLDYPEGATPINIAVTEGATADDDSEGPLAFAPSGFTVTATALPNPPPSPINDPIPSQTAGLLFDLHITAYGQTADDPVCGVIEAYDGVKALRLWSSYIDPATGTRSVTSGGAPIATSEAGATPQNVTFSLGQAQIGLKYKDVGRIQIGMKDDTVAEPAGGIRGASNPFVVRPADIAVAEVTRANDRTAVNPGASGPTGAAFVAAGRPFRVKLRVLDAEGGLTPNFGHEIAAEGTRVRASTLVAPPLALGARNGSDGLGTITNATAFGATDYDGTPVSPGELVANTLSWDEVGIVRLTASIADGDYLGSGEVIGTESGDLGRLYPDHLDVAVSTLAGPPTPTLDAGCTAFTYLDQPLAYTASYAPILTITARSASGGMTQNYYDFGAGQDWWRLTDLPVSYGDPGMPAGVGIDSSAATLTLASGSPTANGSYTQTLSGPLAYRRPAAVAAPPFNAAMQVSVPVAEPAGNDGVAYDDGTGSSTYTFGIGFAAGQGSEQRQGRLRITSASGSELLPLAVPLFAEYYDGSAFVQNSADGCTQLSLAPHLRLSNAQTAGGAPQPGDATMSVGAGGTTSASLATPALTAGQAGLSFSAPGAGNTGYVQIQVEIGALVNTPYWLQYNWSGGSPGHSENPPPARANFGIYQGSPYLIQIREPWN